MNLSVFTRCTKWVKALFQGTGSTKMSETEEIKTKAKIPSYFSNKKKKMFWCKKMVVEILFYIKIYKQAWKSLGKFLCWDICRVI